MTRSPSPTEEGVSSMNRTWLTVLPFTVVACGCAGSKAAPAPPVSTEPTVKVVRAERRSVRRTVAQPGVITAYEQTAIYAKVSGFVRKWHPDIGDRVKKGAPLVEL